jgi:hypothetical protein
LENVKSTRFVKLVLWHWPSQKVLRLQSRNLLQTRQPAEGCNLVKEYMTVHAARPPALVSTWRITRQGDKLHKISKTFNVTLLCTAI